MIETEVPDLTPAETNHDSDTPKQPPGDVIVLLLREVLECLRGLREDVRALGRQSHQTGADSFVGVDRASAEVARPTPALTGLAAILERFSLQPGAPADSPGEEADALANLLAGQVELPEGLGEGLRDWSIGNPDSAARAGLTLVSLDDLGAAETPRLRVGAVPAEWAGIRLHSRLVLPPTVTLTDDPPAHLARQLWELDVEGMTWADKIALGRGQPVPDVALRGLVAWADQLPPDRAQLVWEVLGRQNVRRVEQPATREDPHFQFLELYRPDNRVKVRGLRPAVLRDTEAGAEVLCRGLARVATDQQPPAEQFLTQERTALVESMRGPTGHRYCRLQDTGVRDVQADEVDRYLKGIEDRFRRGEVNGGEGARARARAFGQFFQDYLRVGPAPWFSSPPAWKERRQEFEVAAGRYLRELGIEKVEIYQGQSAVTVPRDHCHRLNVRVEGFKAGTIVEVRVPPLRLPDGSVLSGTLFFAES